MPKQPPRTPRKLPTQERSRATVDAILQATAYILVKRGWEALTTNVIAERAGVNIASLYQFFPNKEAIVLELERRHIEETRAKIREVYARHRGESLRARTRTLVEAGVAAHAVAPELHRVFSNELPRRRSVPTPAPFVLPDGDAELRALDLPHPELAGWMIGTVAHAVVHQGIIERKGDIESGALVDELVTLLVRYVQRTRRKRG